MIPKFRAWDKENDRMIYPNTIGVCFELSNEGIRVLDVDVDYPDDHNFPVIDSVLMQSTGLKDKNGVEIFEGDIVLFSVSDGFNHLVNEKAIVQASECHSGLVCKLVDLDLEYRIYYDPVFHTDYEVIGNVYENKELLEVE